MHGWVYDVRNGLLRDLNVGIDHPNQLEPVYHLEGQAEARP